LFYCGAVPFISGADADIGNMYTHTHACTHIHIHTYAHLHPCAYTQTHVHVNKSNQSVGTSGTCSLGRFRTFLATLVLYPRNCLVRFAHTCIHTSTYACVHTHSYKGQPWAKNLSITPVHSFFAHVVTLGKALQVFEPLFSPLISGGWEDQARH
jgi:hypothetical protein